VTTVEQRLQLELARIAERVSMPDEPSSALLRALLLQASDGTRDGKRELDTRGGFSGGTILRDVASADGFTSSDDTEHVLEFQRLDSDEPLRIDLVWTDEPGR